MDSNEYEQAKEYINPYNGEKEANNSNDNDNDNDHDNDHDNTHDSKNTLSLSIYIPLILFVLIIY